MQRCSFPGVTNAWVMPIKTRIDMLATGIKTPVGIKVAGPDLGEIERIGRDIERVVMARARHHVGLLGARRRRPLYRYHARPGGRRALWAEHRRHQPGDRGRGRRHQYHPDGGGPGALPGQPALPARAARRRRQAARPAAGDPDRRTDSAGPDRRGPDHRRSPDAQERERAAQRLDLRRHPRRRPRQLRGGRAAGGA